MDDPDRPWRLATEPQRCSGCGQYLIPGDWFQADDDGIGIWGQCCGDWRPALAAHRIPASTDRTETGPLTLVPLPADPD
ncbi:hypothetical protein [Krasilnikovia sp. MM14-A1259]|uniref:hypothetical protein n=1 Tax=Krasilnikovia sp. MM14-A1259 TaxID=3373539 RepID=UPI003817AD61